MCGDWAVVQLQRQRTGARARWSCSGSRVVVNCPSAVRDKRLNRTAACTPPAPRCSAANPGILSPWNEVSSLPGTQVLASCCLGGSHVLVYKMQTLVHASH